MRGGFNEDIRVVRVRKRPNKVKLRAHQLESRFEEELDRIHTIDGTAKRTDGIERGVHLVERQQRHNRVRELRNKSEARRGHDPKRALAAAEQTGKVVARVVLLQSVEATDDASISQHRFNPDDLATRRPVAQDVYTARIRCDHASDRRDITRTEIDAVLPPRRARVVLQPGECDAGLGGDLARAHVDRFDGVETANVDDELVVQWDRPADESRIAALRHDRDSLLGAHA